MFAISKQIQIWSQKWQCLNIISISWDFASDIKTVILKQGKFKDRCQHKAAELQFLKKFTSSDLNKDNYCSLIILFNELTKEGKFGSSPNNCFENGQGLSANRIFAWLPTTQLCMYIYLYFRMHLIKQAINCEALCNNKLIVLTMTHDSFYYFVEILHQWKLQRNNTTYNYLIMVWWFISFFFLWKPSLFVYLFEKREREWWREGVCMYVYQYSQLNITKISLYIHTYCDRWKNQELFRWKTFQRNWYGTLKHCMFCSMRKEIHFIFKKLNRLLLLI